MANKQFLHRMKTERIMENLKEKYRAVAKEFPYNVVMAVILQGSQNYNLDVEDSDIDAKAILLPNIDQLIRGDEMVSKTLTMEDGSLVDVKDIRKMVKEFEKRNPSYLELMFTDYAYVPSDYVDEFLELKELGRGVTSTDKIRMYKGMLGTMKTRRKVMENKCHTPSEKRAADIEKYGYDRKSFMHVMRMYVMAFQMIQKGKTFEEVYCMHGAYRDFLMLCRLGKYKDAFTPADNAISAVSKLVDEYVETEFNEENFNSRLEEWAYNVIRYHIVYEVVI